ncbi:hypothetical protein ACFLSQ_09305 [Bacteroidota bacterium]
MVSKWFLFYFRFLLSVFRYPKDGKTERPKKDYTTKSAKQAKIARRKNGERQKISMKKKTLIQNKKF